MSSNLALNGFVDKRRKNSIGKIRMQTADMGSIGVNHIIAIIFPMAVWKEGVGMIEECCGT
jgi:hypothetical protein